MTIQLHTAIDTDTWIVSRSHTCDVDRCSQDAAIITDSDNYDRFCTNHTAEAAVAAQSTGFDGWYRITRSRYDDGHLIVTVHPL